MTMAMRKLIVTIADEDSIILGIEEILVDDKNPVISIKSMAPNTVDVHAATEIYIGYANFNDYATGALRPQGRRA